MIYGVHAVTKTHRLVSLCIPTHSFKMSANSSLLLAHHEDVLGSGYANPLVLDLCISQELRGKLYALAALTRGKIALDKRLCGQGNRSGLELRPLGRAARRQSLCPSRSIGRHICELFSSLSILSI
jgi:hypothetical protein